MEAVNFVPVYRAASETQANMIRIVLEDADIAAVIRPHHSSVFDGMFVVAEGSWGEVLVSEDDLERSREVISEYLRVVESGENKAES